MSNLLRNPYRLVAIILVLALIAVAGWFAFLRPQATLTIKAVFSKSANLFAGNQVTELGMPVGKVTSVDPKGTTTTVTIALPADTKIPATAQAFIMSPDVISDQYLELTPTYQAGPIMANGATIPLGRTHAPIPWDQLVSSMDRLVTAIGPDRAHPDGVAGSALSNMATALNGNGAKIKQALQDVNQASSVVVGGTPDAKALLGSLGKLLDVINANQSAVDSLSNSVGAVSAEFNSQQGKISALITQLSAALGQVSDLLNTNKGKISGLVNGAVDATATLSSMGGQVKALLDVLPLAAQNFDRAINNNTARLRVDVSTNLQQFAAGKAVCQRLPNPLCTGAGLVNPIPVPIPSGLDPFGGINIPKAAK